MQTRIRRQAAAGSRQGPAFCLLLAAFLLLSVLALPALAGAHSGRAEVSLKTYAPVTVDGRLDEWVRRLEQSDWTGRLAIKKGDVLKWMRAAPIHLNALTGRVEAGTIDNPDDASAVVYTLWDAERLYVAAIVSDHEVVSEHEGADIWQDDCLELWFDCRHDAVTRTLFQDDEYQIGLSPASQSRARAVGWAWRNPDPDPVIQAMRVASSAIPGGYVLEASVPWSALRGCQPSIGGLVGFNISLVDKDANQMWTHVTWSGQLHSDPSQFGHLYFVDAPVDLFPSDMFERTKEKGPSPWDTILDQPSQP